MVSIICADCVTVCNISGACGGGYGLLLERYVVNVTAAYNGERR